MIEFDRGNFRVPDHRVSKSLGHRREDLSRTILSARRKSPAPQRERTTSGRAKVANGKRDFVVPTGTDCFAQRDCGGQIGNKKRLWRCVYSRTYALVYRTYRQMASVVRPEPISIPDLLRYTIFQSGIINANGCHQGDAL